MSQFLPGTRIGMSHFFYVRVMSITSAVQWSYLIRYELALFIFHRISYIKPIWMSSEYYPWVPYLFDHYVKWIIMHSRREAALRLYIASIFIKEDAFSALHMIWNVLLYRGYEGREKIQLLQYGATLDIILVLLVCMCVVGRRGNGGGGGEILTAWSQ